MAAIRASITIDLPDGVDYDHYINAIRSQLNNITGLDTKVSIKDVDNPISMSPVNIKKIKD